MDHPSFDPRGWMFRRYPSVRHSVRDLAPQFTDGVTVRFGGGGEQIYDQAMGRLVAEWNGHLAKLPLEDRKAHAHGYYDIVDEMGRLAAFERFGRNTFMIRADVLHALGLTDATAVRLSDIRFPYPAFFVALDEPVPAPDGSDELVGFWCRASDTEIRLCLRYRPCGGVWPDFRLGPMRRIALARRDDVSLVDALDDEVMQMAARAQELRAEMERATGDVPGLVVLHVTSAEREVIEIGERRGQIIRDLGLIGNVLCLLSARPDDIIGPLRLEPSGRAVDDLAKNQRQLAIKNGEVPVRTISFGPSGHAGSHSTSGSTVRAHWRRGHWRRQRSGRGLQAIVLRWIRPTLVRGGNGAEAERTVYLVRP